MYDCLVIPTNTNICTPFMLFYNLHMFFLLICLSSALSTVFASTASFLKCFWKSIYHIYVRHMGQDRPEAVNKIYLLTYSIHFHEVICAKRHMFYIWVEWQRTAFRERISSCKGLYLVQTSNLKTHLRRQWNCWSLRCSWSIACRLWSNCIFLLD